MAKRIHYDYDGTLVYGYNPSNQTKYQVTDDLRARIDGDTALFWTSSLNPYGFWMFYFPSTIQVAEVKLKCTSSLSDISFMVSNDSTDGIDGTWTEKGPGGNYTAYEYTTFTLTLADTRWLRIGYSGSIIPFPCYSIHIFGEYQSPLYEFWNNAESAELTTNYPFEMADAPNDVNYEGHVQFKIKNLDSVAHQYSLIMSPIRYLGDDLISNHFSLSLDGGVTKTLSARTASVAAGGFSGTIDVYGTILRTDNPFDGRHYFWVDVVEALLIVDDTFGAGTQQDFIPGGDGEKLYSWCALNTVNATTIDTNITNAGKMTLIANSNSSIAQGTSFTAPFIFQQITGDFDVEMYLESRTFASNFEQCGLCVRDPLASTSEDFVKIVSVYYNGLKVVWVNNVAGSTGTLYGSSVACSDSYLRLKRVGNTVTVYSKANPGDTWTEKGSFTRDDLSALVQVGVLISTQNNYGTLNAQVDYFRITV